MCVSFALYGLLRKIVPADAITGLAIETAILFPLAIAWLGWRALAGAAGDRHQRSLDAGLLLLAGIVSTTPLLLFTAAAQAPALFDPRHAPVHRADAAVPDRGLLYGEPFTTAHAIAFPAIWVALALYVIALLRAPRLPQAPE